MKPQPIRIHGVACQLTRAANHYQVTARGLVVASAPMRLLAIARAALAISHTHAPAGAA